MRAGLRGALVLGLGVAAFLAAAAAVRGVLPWPYESSLDARWRAFRAHAGDYDVVFVGSSYVARAVEPAVLDRELARLGRPLRSFNLAADNMQAAEAGHVLREIVGLGSPRLRFAVMELLEFAPRGMLKRSAFTDRGIYWHDARGLADALRRVAGSAEPRMERLRLGWLHLRHAAWRFANFGRAERAIAAWRRGPDPADLAVAAAGGFEALDERPEPSSLEVHETFLRSLPGYLARLEEIDLRNRVPGIAPPELLRVVHEQTARLRAAGIEPIYFVPPVPWAAPELLAIAREPGGAAVVALNSPARFPELYDPAHRWDAIHVNRAGAALMSAQLAAELAPKLAADARD